MGGDDFTSMLRAKFDEGLLSKEEFELILSTHELGVDDADDEYIEVGDTTPVPPPTTDEALTVTDLEGLDSTDQIWLLDQVKSQTMTISEAVGLAKQSPERIARTRRVMVKRAADLRKERAHQHFSIAEALAEEVHAAVVRSAAVDLARLSAAAATIEAAKTADCARQDIVRAQAAITLQTNFRMLHSMHKVQDMTDAADVAHGKKKTVRTRPLQKKKKKKDATSPESTSTPPPSHPPQSPPQSKKIPSYLLAPIGSTTGFELVLTRETGPDGKPLPLGLDISYKKLSFFGRGTKAVIVGVARNSPADEARLEVGDQIIEICSVKLVTLTIDQCKRLMQESRIRITVTKSITAKDQKKIDKVVEHATRTKAKEASKAPPRGSPGQHRKQPNPPQHNPSGEVPRATAALYDRPECRGSIIYDSVDNAVESDAASRAASDAAGAESRAQRDSLYAEVNREHKHAVSPPLPDRIAQPLTQRSVEEVVTVDPPLYAPPQPHANEALRGGVGGDSTAPTVAAGLSVMYEKPSPHEPAPALYEQPGPNSAPPAVYEAPTAMQGDGKAVAPDEDSIYEVPSPTESAQKLYESPFTLVAGYGGQSQATGYGDGQQEPLYETIPGDDGGGSATIAAGPTPPAPTVFVGGGVDDFAGDDEYEEVMSEVVREGGAGAGRVPGPKRVDIVWSVLGRNIESAPEYIVSYPGGNTDDGEDDTVQYQMVVGSTDEGRGPGEEPLDVNYTEVVVGSEAAKPLPKTHDGLQVNSTGGSNRFMDLRAALDNAEGDDSRLSPDASAAAHPPLTGEYAEYTELSTVGVSLEWFAGAMAKRPCENAVISSAHGAFLIRESTTADRFVLCVNDHGTAVNFPVNLTAEGNTCSFGTKTFVSLHDLVDHLRTAAVRGRDGTPLRLTDAAPGGTVLVLQALAPPPPPPPPPPLPPPAAAAPVPPPRPSSREHMMRRASESAEDSGKPGVADLLGVKLRSVSKDDARCNRVPPAPQKADLFSLLMSEMLIRRTALGVNVEEVTDGDHRDSFACVEYMDT